MKFLKFPATTNKQSMMHLMYLKYKMEKKNKHKTFIEKKVLESESSLTNLHILIIIG